MKTRGRPNIYDEKGFKSSVVCFGSVVFMFVFVFYSANLHPILEKMWTPKLELLIKGNFKATES